MDDSFDFDEFETLAMQQTVTAWSSHVAPKTRTRRTYSLKGGSTGTATNASNLEPEQQPKRDEPLNWLCPTEEEPEHSESEDNPMPTFKQTVPRIPGRRRFVRAHSISAISEPKSQPLIRRSVSVCGSAESTSLGSFRSSSISSSLSELSGENVHPNLDPLEEQASPKRCAIPAKDHRGRKKVRSAKNLKVLDTVPSVSASTSSTFSNLARDDGTTWANPPLPPSDYSPFPTSLKEYDFLDTSPAMSSVGSQRKRGICETPRDTFDDCQSTNGFSLSRHSTSRSRILSPPVRQLSEFSMDQSDRMIDFSLHSVGKTSKVAMMEIASDDGDSAPESHDGLDSDDDIHVDKGMHRRSAAPTFVPFEQRQKNRSAIPRPSGPMVQPTPISQEKNEVDQVLRTMSSFQDLRFLTKTMRREKEVSRVSWHVALPIAWSGSRRAACIQWATNSLGFTLRAAGGQVAFLQISKSKGETILKVLEESLTACKERGIDSRSPVNAMAPTNQFLFGPTSNIVVKSPKELTFNSEGVAKPDFSSQLDDDFLERMTNLGMNEKALPQHDYPVRPSIIIEDGDDLSRRDPRPSLENHSNSRDLMAHMHGLTPVPRRGRPPRLSLQSVGSVSTTGTATKKFNSASPFPQPPISTIGSSHVKSFAYEFVETPMMRQPDVGWGSCPIEGRDWGCSTPCENAILQAMLRRLERARIDAGFCDSPYQSELEAVGPRPCALGLDLEAASTYREPVTSTPDKHNEENCEQTFFPDGIPESSPSSSSCLDRVEISDVHLPTGTVGHDSRALRRRQTAFAKHKRISLFASAVNPAATIFNNRKSLFTREARVSFIADRNLATEHEFGADFRNPQVHCSSDVTAKAWVDDDALLKRIFEHLSEPELLRTASLVCTKWADIATEAHAKLMLLSVGCKDFLSADVDDNDDDDNSESGRGANNPSSQAMVEKTWQYLNTTFPWARFLAEGGFKTVYKVFNHTHRVEEALSIMDINVLKDTGEMNVVGAELAVSVMLTSLVRRGVCPNFVVTRGAFSCPYKPPAHLWGSETNKCPKGDAYTSPMATKNAKAPRKQGHFQYIRMELCDRGDAEEYIKTLPDELLPPELARQLLFQMTFALHAAANRYSLKHYDIKLLNYFVQTMESEKAGDVILRYGLGEHIFVLRSPRHFALMAKLADYGTANVDSATNGQQVTIAQFTTLENTPADFMILGDNACQGHGHDSFGLGLCMLHLYTGHAPYEEILEDVTCPSNLKEKLRNLWENEDETEFSVLRSVILSDVDKDEEGHVIEGEPNEVLYDTFYRFLVLFGLPELPPLLRNSKVWVAVRECLEGIQNAKGKPTRKRKANDISRFTRDCRKYSLTHGNNRYIARARKSLETMDGGMELLRGLVSFDPNKRFTALDVMNSQFMMPLREPPGGLHQYSEEDDVRNFTSFSTHS